METLLIWKIVLPVVVIIGSIAVYYAAINIMKEKNNTYIYPKTGNKYVILGKCKLKCPIDRKWYEAVIYQGLDTGMVYVRERKDFLDKFVKFLDWKDGTGRTEKRKG